MKGIIRVLKVIKVNMVIIIIFVMANWALQKKAPRGPSRGTCPKIKKISRGEICVENFIPHCK